MQMIPPESEHPAFQTLRMVLKLLSLDAGASAILRSQSLSLPSSTASTNVLDQLQSIALSGSLPDNSSAQNLGNTILSLVKSDILVLGDKTNVPPPTEKRKREKESSSEPQAKRHRAASESTSVDRELVTKLTSSVSVLKSVFDKKPSIPPTEMLNLHTSFQQVFTFAVSSSRVVHNPVGYEASALQLQLQEISGLIQVLGVLSGIPFAEDQRSGTTVFPCSSPSCGKTFSTYATLTAHVQFLHASSSTAAGAGGADKVHQCTNCRQSFMRLHDLKRHLLTHAVLKHVFQCSGCERIFTRRDAAKRHIDGAREKLRVADMSGTAAPQSGQGGKEKCADAEIVDVERTTSSVGMDKFVVSFSSPAVDDDPEEGEIPRTILSMLYGIVLGLAAALRAWVNNGGSTEPSEGAKATPPPPPTASKHIPQKATLPPVLQLAPPSVVISPHPQHHPQLPAPPKEQQQPSDPSIEEAIRSVLAFASQQQSQHDQGHSEG